MSSRTRTHGATVKITDVAAAAGVAPMTVSRVLNTPERVSEETAARVRAAIERLGYVPNLIAGGLSSRRSRMIAAIVPTIASPMFYAPVQPFTDTLAQSGYHVMLALSGYEEGSEDGLIRAVLSRRPDGLLLTGAAHSPAVRRLLRDAGVPVVEIWDATETPTDMLVGFDHAELGAAVADFFAAAGHTHFAVLAASDPRASARRAGFVARLARHGGTLVAERTLPAPSGIEDGRAALRDIAPLLTRRTALFGSSDLVAYGAIVEARARGIAVPAQLAVCGFGDFEISRASELPFTTVSIDGAAMGRMAAEHLLARIAGRPAPPRILMPARIIARAST
ncbi:MAG: LacI family DNA-binding transcriptional regulator [Rhodospirillales bacterium]|nr:LacI family DNA-binding transcriptional regulator [Rhodospirillales bacterium]